MPITLKLQRVFAYTIYRQLRNTPPKEYPTTGEIKETIGAILPSFKSHVSGYTDLISKAEAIHLKIATKELSEEAGQVEIDKVNDELKAYNAVSGKDVCEIELSEEGFKTLKTQFEREHWGTEWTSNLEEYAELSEAFAAAGK